MHAERDEKHGRTRAFAGVRSSLAAVLCACTLVASGCGTIDSQRNYWSGETFEGAGVPRVYVFGGAANDACWGATLVSDTHRGNHELYVLLPLVLIDFPLSLGLDAVLLPLTVGEEIEAALHTPAQ